MNEKEKVERVDVCDVTRWEGQSIQLPEGPPGMGIPDAVKVLMKMHKHEESVVDIEEKVTGFPWDVARAFKVAMERLYGYSGHTEQVFAGMFGEVKVPPKEIAVEVAFEVYENVPWGVFELPGSEGALLELKAGRDDRGRIAVVISTEIKRKYSGMVRELAEVTREVLREDSIYLGKAIKVEFCDESGGVLDMPTVGFISPKMLDKSVLVFNAGLEGELEDYVYGPLRHGQKEEYGRFGREFKRGILLAGDHGTGKTLLTCRIAREAIDSGVTAIYIEDVKQLPHALNFATTYLPAVIIGEDIDRAVQEERDDLTNVIFNTLDGIDTKDHEIMVVVTTNNPGKLHPGLLRPGRLDHRIFVDLPDADTVERLLWAYAEDQVGEGESLDGVAEALVGIKPSQVKNVIDRAKDGMVRRYFDDGGSDKLMEGDLMTAALNFQKEEEMVQKATVKDEVKRFGLHELEFVKKEGNGQVKVDDKVKRVIREFAEHAERVM